MILQLMKLNVAQIYIWHTEFTFISSKGFSLLKHMTRVGCWIRIVAWLAGFTAFQTTQVSDYSLHNLVKQKNLVFRTPKSPSQLPFHFHFPFKGHASPVCSGVTLIPGCRTSPCSRLIFILISNSFQPSISTS